MNSPLFRYDTFEAVICQVETTPLIKMERYTLQKRIEIIKTHYKNGENLAETVRKTRKFLGRREAPWRTAIKKLVSKIRAVGTS